MKTVLAPIDFSPISDRVIETAIALARALGARLVLLHVVASPPLVGKSLALTAAGAKLATAGKKAATQKLVELQRSLRDRGITAHAIHTNGDPREGIIEQAERLSADYIVVGSHGRTAFYDLLVGSTAMGVLKRANCPVAIVPAKSASVARSPKRLAKQSVAK